MKIIWYTFSVMDKLKNQRGFATLEIILAVSIIAIFATVAVPKMARVLDKVYLNYEMKRLYSELNFARSLGKFSDYKVSVFTGGDYKREPVFMRIYYNLNKYEILRNLEMGTAVISQHNLQNGITFSNNSGLEDIKFDNPSRYSTGSNTITLKSQFDDSAYIIFNSVGRWRGNYVKK